MTCIDHRNMNVLIKSSSMRRMKIGGYFCDRVLYFNPLTNFFACFDCRT